MTSNLYGSPRFPSLERLGDELLRVARTESRGRRRRSQQRVAIALAVAVLVVPGSLAIARGGDSASGKAPGESSAGSVAESLPPSSAPATPVIPGTVTGFPSDESADIDFSSPGIPPTWLVEDCRGANPAPSPLHCEAIIAIAEHRLAPGDYSNEELRALFGGGDERRR